jgi:hypothetical protein
LLQEKNNIEKIRIEKMVFIISFDFIPYRFTGI